MVKVQQNLEALLNDDVRLATFYIHDEANAAGFVFEGGVVKALCPRA